MLKKFENSAKSDPVNQDALLMKVKMQREKIQVIKNPDEFQKLIDALRILLIEIEALLQRQACKYSNKSDFNLFLFHFQI